MDVSDLTDVRTVSGLENRLEGGQFQGAGRQIAQVQDEYALKSWLLEISVETLEGEHFRGEDVQR